MGLNLKLWPFSRSKAQTDADRLVAVVSQISRQPGFYGAERTPDTMEGRLELLMLHGALAFVRLRREPELAPVAQAFADALFRHFDDGLREAGVGDLAVPKRMHKIAGDFYGRLDAYAAALAGNDQVQLADALSRNVLGKTQAGYAPVLAAYAAEVAAKQAENGSERLLFLDAWGQAPA